MEGNFPNEQPAFIFNQLERKALLDSQKLLTDNEKLVMDNQELLATLDTARLEYRKLNNKQKVDLETTMATGKKAHNLQLKLIQLFAGTMLNNGLSGNNHTDAGKIMGKLAQANIELPCGMETLAKYLKQDR